MTTTPNKQTNKNAPAAKPAPAKTTGSAASTTGKGGMATKNTGSGPRVTSSNIGLWLIAASVAIVALVVGIIVFNENRASSAPVAQPNVPAAWINRNNVGNPEAPVTIQLWEDFLCPSCQAFATTVKPLLMEQYVTPGKVKVEYHYFPLSQHEPGATMTALAAECAADQGMFWPYHDRVFSMTKVNQQGAATFDQLVGYAKGMGMDEAKFRTCLSGQQHRDTVSKSLAQATQMQLDHTPTVIVGKTVLPDYSWQTVQAEVDKQLAAAGSK